MKSVKRNVDLKQMVDSDRTTKEGLMAKLGQISRQRQEQMLFELCFLRDVVDESLRIEAENLSSGRSESSFDHAEVTLQQ